MKIKKNNQHLDNIFCDLGISRGRFFDCYFGSQKLDLYFEKYGTYCCTFFCHNIQGNQQTFLLSFHSSNGQMRFKLQELPDTCNSEKLVDHKLKYQYCSSSEITRQLKNDCPVIPLLLRQWFSKINIKWLHIKDQILACKQLWVS